MIPKAPIPGDDILHKDKSIMVSSSRIETKTAGYAVKYISGILIKESHPPRTEALVVFLFVLCAIGVLAYHLISDRISESTYFMLLACGLFALLVSGAIFWFAPSRYEMTLTLINGDKVAIKTKTEERIISIHDAIRTAIAMNRQDPVVSGPPVLTRVVRPPAQAQG